MLECQICNETVTVLEARRPHETYITGVITDVRIIHPLPEPEGLDDSIPTDIADLFREGSLCETVGAYRAAAGVYRACVEMVCKDQGFTSGKLYDKIEALKASLGADSYIADDMHEARSLGNDGLHDGLAYSHAEVQDVAGLIREALLVLYVQPAEKKRFKELRQANRAAFRAQGRGNNSATAAPPAPQS